MTLHPDIILLVLDTQRIDRLSCYGHKLETSPYLDAFAEDATLFRHAFSTAQWTIPSHASMFTGLYPNQHSMLHASSVLPDTLTPLAERLASAGYFTAAFCNNPLIGVVNTGLQRGFASFLNYGGWMTSRPHQSGTSSHLLDRYRQHFKRFLAGVVTSLQDIFARSDTLLDLSFSPLMAPLWQTALSFKGNTAKALQDAVRLHSKRSQITADQPIFSFINLMGTHMPYHPPPRFVERFAAQTSQGKVARRYLRQFNSDVFGWMAPLTSAIDEEQKATLDGMYNAEVASQDELVGAFFEQLRTSGALDHTLVIVCADHGEHLGEHQFMGHSISLYNTLVHVPLIIYDPSGDLPRGSTVDRFVSTRRIFQTALTAAGCATEHEQALTLAQSPISDPDHGHIFATGITPQNLLNVMRRRRPDLIQMRRCDQPRLAVWNDRYKLIQTGQDELELYDSIDDPDEAINLCDILPEQVEALQEQLQGFMGSLSLTTSTEKPLQGTEQAETSHDPLVHRRLHDLGYLE
ncbi:MAG TPA: sulfatase-like hydrolase/transferase [Ktedonosporobacter sp.]|nr:sulfatase-like hydrolase/transferase [Ktedonosporobacter sp.]